MDYTRATLNCVCRTAVSIRYESVDGSTDFRHHALCLS